MSVRRLGAVEVDLFKAIRLEALRDSPVAFGSTFEAESKLTSQEWAQRLSAEDRATFVAEDENTTAAGVAVGAPDIRDPSAAFLLSMWVAPPARGTGVADELVEAVIKWAGAEGYQLIRLHVTDGNDRAESLYRRRGFRMSGASTVRHRDGLREREMILKLFAG